MMNNVVLLIPQHAPNEKLVEGRVGHHSSLQSNQSNVWFRRREKTG